jgi:hypothetical protein
MRHIERLDLNRRLVLISGFAAAATVMFLPVLLSSTISHGPDAATHVFNSELYRVEMESGVFFPRWLGEWYGGFGAPIGVAYSPLTYLTTASLSLLGFGTLPALKIVLWLSVFLSGLWMFLFSRRVFPDGPAAVAGLAYMVTPYRVIDLFGRTAFPEAVAFVWLPLIALYLFDTVAKTSRVAHLFLGLCCGLLILTHSMIAYLSFLTAIFVFFLVFIFTNLIDKYVLLRLVGSSLICFGISAIYWLPVVRERRWLNTQWFSEEGVVWGDYRNNFVLNAEIYRGTDFHKIFIENFTIGIVVLLLIGVCAFSIRKILETGDFKKSPSNAISFLMFSVLLLSIFLTTKNSSIIWQALPFARVIAFPWRWLTVSSFAASFLIGDIVSWQIQKYSSTKRRLGIDAVFLPLLLVAFGAYSTALIVIHRDQITPEQAADILYERPLSPELFGWVYDKPFIPIWGRYFDYLEASRRGRQKVFAGDGATLDVGRWESTNREIEVYLDAPRVAAVRTFWYPGWLVEVNEGEKQVPGRNGEGLLTVDLPEGRSKVVLTFEDTGTRFTAKWLSMFTGLVWLAWLIASKLKQREDG